MLAQCAGSLEACQREKRDPNDADDAGQDIISIIGGLFLHFWPPLRPMTPH